MMFLLAIAMISAQSDSLPRLGLDEALRLARAANPDLARSHAATDAASARRDQGFGALLPSVGLASEYDRLGPNPSGDARYNAASKIDRDALWKTTLEAKWTVFDGFKSWQGLDALNARRDAATAMDSATMSDVDQAVVGSWTNLWLAEKRVEASRSSLDISRLRRDVARVRHDLGVLAGLETTQGEIDAARDSLAWLRAVAARDGSARDLNMVLGRTPSILVAASEFAASDTTDPLDGKSASESSDLRATRLLEEAASKDLSASYSTFWPSVDLFVDYNHQGTFHDGGTPANDWNQGTLYGARATWNLFEGGRNTGRIREANAVQSQAKTLRMALERTHEAALASARSRWETAKSALRLESFNDVQTESVLKAALSRYQSGDLAGLDLRRYQDSRIQAQVQYAEARAELLLSGIAWRRAAGLSTTR